jgi:pilus assembly protein CpaB
VSGEANAIGKVLLRAVEEGEAITSGLFAGLGSGVHLASALKPGMRAVSVTLTDNMGLEHLLYPGSVVDVLASMAVRDDAGGEARPVSMTLLQGVFVLAVGDETVVSESAQATDVGSLMRQPKRPSVTLLVDSKQAELLKLAMQEGSVSMVLRNPADERAVVAEGTPLYELSPILEAPRARREVVVFKGGQAETKTLAAHSRP